MVALASTMTYAGFLVVGVVAEHLGTGRALAGLLLGIIFARIPRISKGKLQTVGLLPKPARLPIMVGLLTLCLVTFLSRGDYVAVVFAGIAMAFILTFPWIKRAVSGRVLSSIFRPATNAHRPQQADDTVIDVEFREKKD
ncbi:hypothetical protein SAMN05428948_1701 [Massilia sp. CF038]|nr:hypothetical protein SAMN05428948_1701 [Massilia sp. CF038]